MKKLFSLLLAAIMLLGMAGIAAADEINYDVTEPTKVVFWHTLNDEDDAALLERIIKEFEAEHPLITIEPVYYASYNKVNEALAAANVANVDVPGCAFINVPRLKAYADNGVIENLDPYIAHYGVDMSDFYEGLLPNCYVDDTIYGLPYLRSTPIMYCNNTLLNEAGWDYKDIRTWDDLKTAATAVHDKTGKYGASQYSYLWTLDAFMIEHGSSILNESEDATLLNTAEGKEVIGFWRDLIDQGIVHAYNHTEQDKVTTDVQNLNTAIWFGSTGSLKDNLAIADELGFELGTAYIPKAVEYGTPTGGCCVVMMSNISDKEKVAAWEFMKYMTETEQAIKSSIKTGYLPSRKSAGESDTMQKYFVEMPLAKVALDQLGFVKRAAYSNPNYTEAGAEIEKALDAIYLNGADIDSTLADLETKVNKILNQ